MAGYQGWFNAPDDGAGRGWYHYRGQDGFRPGSCSVDFWPEVSEYATIYRTDFHMDDGSPAYVFSSHDASTVDTHFRWMKEYGLDGVFMQRFVSEIHGEKGRAHFNKVLDSAMKAARRYERAICIMYDLSGMKSGDERVLLQDVLELSTRYSLFEHEKNPSYLYHNGRPLVSVWGVGFDDGRAYGLDEAETIVSTLKRAGFSVMLGVPTRWRELKDDTGSDPRLHDLIRECDVVMPWFVGRYNESAFKSFQPLIRKDLAWARQNGVDYAPLCYPGFSWKNLNAGSEETLFIPRNKGAFLWTQLAYAVEVGAEMIYVAMFDEIDEGTAIFKCAGRVPVREAGTEFVPLEDGVSNDHYLWLVGQAGRMLRGEIPLQRTMPVRDDLTANK